MDKQKLIHQLFIGKVTEILGNEKTTELLREAKIAIESVEPQLKQPAIKSVCVDCKDEFEAQMERCCVCENNKEFPM